MILYKNVPGKKSDFIKTKDVQNLAKKGAIDIKTPLDIVNMQKIRKKVLFTKLSQT